jgi:hypothetical protein
MRHRGSITSVSWIPPRAVEGLAKLPFGAGVAHWDLAPPEQIGPPGATLQELAEADRFRFANHLSAWIDVDDGGTITGYGYDGGGVIGSTRLALGTTVTVPATALPDLQAEPELVEGGVRFMQTAGGRTGVPAPRTVRRPPFVQYHAPIAWSTLSLTIAADGTVTGSMVGASPFPRHWVYDVTGNLAGKTGVIDFTSWYKDAFGDHTPWGDLDSPALVTAVESALERQLVDQIMDGGRRPRIESYAAGTPIVLQGDVGHELFLLLDGVMSVSVNGSELGHVGPGVVLGERAVLEGGIRTATLTAVTKCRCAVVSGSELDSDALAALSTGHRREESQ